VDFEELGSVAVNDNFLDKITARNGVDHVLPFGHFAEDGVFSIEMWGGAMGYEELRTIGVGTGVGHGEDAGFVMTAMGLAFTLEFVTGITTAASIRATTLDHEVGNHPVKGQSVVKFARGEVEEGANGDGCVIGEEGEVDVALAGLHSNFDIVHVGDNLARI